MIAIRVAKRHWGKAWRAMIEVAPVRLVADDPVYEVLPAHLELLTSRGFTYEIVKPQPGRKCVPKRALRNAQKCEKSRFSS
jgi:hypothetical protein